MKKYVFAELLENSLKNWAIFHSFAVLAYRLRDFTVYLIDLGSNIRDLYSPDPPNERGPPSLDQWPPNPSPSPSIQHC